MLKFLLCGILVVLFTDYSYGMSSKLSHFFKNNGTNGGKVSIKDLGSVLEIDSNGIPDHIMQRVNPNHAQSQNFRVRVPKTVNLASTPGCLPMGPIGIARDGVAIFNPLDADGENAVEGSGSERFDSCDGHAQQTGIYHYHKIPDHCLYRGHVDEFVGTAFDGIPIYGPRVSFLNREITSKDLDECHGKEVDGEYRYYVTRDFPYYLGCFKGHNPDNHHTQYSCDGKTSGSSWGYICTCGTPGGGPGGQRQRPQQMNNQHLQQPFNHQQNQNARRTDPPPTRTPQPTRHHTTRHHTTRHHAHARTDYPATGTHRPTREQATRPTPRFDRPHHLRPFHPRQPDPWAPIHAFGKRR